VARDFIARMPSTVALAITTLPLGGPLVFDRDRGRAIGRLHTAFEGTTRRLEGLEGTAGFGCTDAAASEGCGNQGFYPKLRAPEARAKNRAVEWTLRGRKTLSDLQGLFRTLSSAPADVVIVSGGLPFNNDLRREIEDTLLIAGASGVRVHSIELSNLTRVVLPEGGADDITADPMVRLNLPPGIRQLPETNARAYGLPDETGGLDGVGSVSGADFFERLGRELSSTYLLAFEPTQSDRDARAHRIEVRVAGGRPLTIHARKHFAELHASPSRSIGTAEDAKRVSASLPTPTAALGRSGSKTDTWLALSRAHVPGARDQALIELGQWQTPELQAAFNGLPSLRRRLGPDAANVELLRAALLHTDLALLAPDLALRFGGFAEWDTLPSVQAADGRTLGTSVVSAHWRLARSLLDRVQPHPSDNRRVLEWYRAVGATLLATRQFAAALSHLADARRVFPVDVELNTLAGLLHESLAAAASSGLPGNATLALGTARAELEGARREFRRAADADPSADDAQLHLGRVCHLLGDDSAASAAAAAVLSRTSDPKNRYIAELLNGSIHQVAGRFGPARESYERATLLYPKAQVPVLALSALAWQAGDRSESRRRLEPLGGASSTTDEREDPWWTYDSAFVTSRATLLDALRTALADGRPR